MRDIDIEDFYGGKCNKYPDIKIDELATEIKSLIKGRQDTLIEELKVELYVQMIPHMKGELCKMTIARQDWDDAIALSWTVFEYLIDKWEVKYYNKSTEPKKNGMKRNSFIGYFRTFYKGILYQKWMYNKDNSHCGLLKRSKHLDMKNKAGGVTDTISYSFDEEIFPSHQNEGIECVEGVECVYNMIREKYNESEAIVILYLGGIGGCNRKDIRNILGMSIKKCDQFVKEVSDMVRGDDWLRDQLKSMLS